MASFQVADAALTAGSVAVAASPTAGVLDGIGSALAWDHPVFDCEAVEHFVAGAVAVGAVGKDGVDAHARRACGGDSGFEGGYVGGVSGVELVGDDEPFGGVGDRRLVAELRWSLWFAPPDRAGVGVGGRHEAIRDDFLAGEAPGGLGDDPLSQGDLLGEASRLRPAFASRLADCPAGVREYPSGAAGCADGEVMQGAGFTVDWGARRVPVRSPFEPAPLCGRFGSVPCWWGSPAGACHLPGRLAAARKGHTLRCSLLKAPALKPRAGVSRQLRSCLGRGRQERKGGTRSIDTNATSLESAHPPRVARLARVRPRLLWVFLPAGRGRV